MDEKKIARINELARKKKTIGLSVEEQEEQALLRKEYIEAYKANLESQLKSITVQNEDGSRHKLKKKTVHQKSKKGTWHDDTFLLLGLKYD